MNDEKLASEQAVRVLRAKADELEAIVRDAPYEEDRKIDRDLAADVALVAQLLADHIERTTSGHATGDGR
jgi:hypothetical protein